MLHSSLLLSMAFLNQVTALEIMYTIRSKMGGRAGGQTNHTGRTCTSAQPPMLAWPPTSMINHCRIKFLSDLLLSGKNRQALQKLTKLAQCVHLNVLTDLSINNVGNHTIIDNGKKGSSNTQVPTTHQQSNQKLRLMQNHYGLPHFRIANLHGSLCQPVKQALSGNNISLSNTHACIRT